MKQSFKWNSLPLNKYDDSFLNTKLVFTPETLEYDDDLIPYDAMLAICDYFNKLVRDYVSRSNIKHEKIKNPVAREKAIHKQIVDCQKSESKAQAILQWLGIKRKPDIPEPKGTKYVERSQKSGWATGLPKEELE